jgi:phasin family protein
MPSVLNPIADMYQTQLEASRRFADVVFSGVEKIDHVMIDATHRMFTEQINFVQAMASVRDPRGIANLQSTYFSHRPENALAYQKELVKVFAEMQSEIGNSMQDCMEQFRGNVVSGKNDMKGAASAQSTDTVFNPMTGMFAAWQSAMKDAVSMADRNIDAIRTRYESGVNTATHMFQEAGNAATRMNEASSNLAGQMEDSMRSASMTDQNSNEKKSSSGLKRK